MVIPPWYSLTMLYRTLLIVLALLVIPACTEPVSSIPTALEEADAAPGADAPLTDPPTCDVEFTRGCDEGFCSITVSVAYDCDDSIEQTYDMTRVGFVSQHGQTFVHYSYRCDRTQVAFWTIPCDSEISFVAAFFDDPVNLEPAVFCEATEVPSTCPEP